MATVSVPASLDLDLDLLKGPKGDPGDPGTPGAPGAKGDPGTTPDLSAYATKADVADMIAKAIATVPPPVVVPPVVVPPVVVPPTPGRPAWLPAIVPSRTVQLPPSIDKTGATDMTVALRTFIATVGSNSLIRFGGGRIKVSGSVLTGGVVKGKSGIVFDGEGCILDNVSGNFSSTASNEHSTFYWSWLDTPFPTDLAFRNFVSLGARPLVSGKVKLAGSEFAAFAHFMGGARFEVENISGQGHWGDLVTLNEGAQNVWIHGNKPKDVGRNNVSIVFASHVLIEDNAFGDAGYCTFDIEPEKSSTPGGITDIIYRRNSSGGWDNCYIAVDGANSGHPLGLIVIDSNVSRASVRSIIGYSLGAPGARIKGLTYTNNKGPAGGIDFHHIDGLVEHGNDGTITVDDCPGAVRS